MKVPIVGYSNFDKVKFSWLSTGLLYSIHNEITPKAVQIAGDRILSCCFVNIDYLMPFETSSSAIVADFVITGVHATG